MIRLLDYLLTLPQYVLPQHGLTGLVYRLTRIRVRWFKNLLIRAFIYLFGVDMQEAEKSGTNNYASFNQFFTRSLKQDTRQWSGKDNELVSPVDGRISQLGTITNGRLIQSKGKDYTLQQLLANDDELVAQFREGQFATLYLSPGDYHRIHMPVSGTLLKTIYVPGKLFAVNNPAVRTVDGLFARNERFISICDTDYGRMALIMVGALFVGSMETVWAGQITPCQDRQLAVQHFAKDEVRLAQGDEFGRFNMGSTVILLLEQDRLSFLPDWHAGNQLQVGNPLGTLTRSD